MTKPTRGGARINAGRPAIANKAQSRTLRLTDEHWLKFKQLGGIKWLKKAIKTTDEIKIIVDFCNQIIKNHDSDAIFIRDQVAINTAICIREFALNNPNYQLES